VEALLDLMDTLTTPLARPELVSLTAWFHDAIYSTAPGLEAGQNEKESADLFLAFVSDIKAASGETWNKLSEADVECVHRWIVCTATHIVPERKGLEADGQMFLDMDLSILAAPGYEYRLYVASIRREYESYSEEQFRTGRAAVLQSMLREDCRLYVTPEMHERFEEQARQNLADELRSLTA
jgi:predicted metal-dependent HD superfamily phosphohydrolase